MTVRFSGHAVVEPVKACVAERERIVRK